MLEENESKMLHKRGNRQENEGEKMFSIFIQGQQC